MEGRDALTIQTLPARGTARLKQTWPRTYACGHMRKGNVLRLSRGAKDREIRIFSERANANRTFCFPECFKATRAVTLSRWPAQSLAPVNPCGSPLAHRPRQIKCRDAGCRAPRPSCIYFPDCGKVAPNFPVLAPDARCPLRGLDTTSALTWPLICRGCKGRGAGCGSWT